jgi:hypothetical protein
MLCSFIEKKKRKKSNTIKKQKLYKLQLFVIRRTLVKIRKLNI